jgi:hypothetical protein
MEITMAENGKDIRKITGAVEDAVTYPILTRDITAPPPSDGAGVSGGRASLDSVALDTIRRLLGWRYRSDDTKGFLAALDKTFLLKQVEGHIEWDVKPQNYMVQADLGEITGAQASIYARAKVSLDQSMPLLDGLTLLGAPQFDVEDMEATRALVRTELTDLVGELGKVGGPRIQRVDSLFTLLLGQTPEKALEDPTNVGGQLKILAERFGLLRENVNTIDDEQDLTNYLILVDYVGSLYQTWTAQRPFFVGTAQSGPFLGTQLVLISQTLDALAESVQAAYDAMDSVFFGPSERQATRLDFPIGEPSMTVSDLLSWVDDFATKEGLQLLQEGGKDGLVAFSATINKLQFLVFLATKESDADSSDPVHGFHTVRVRRALQRVQEYLQQTEEEAEQIQRKDFAPLAIRNIEVYEPFKGPYSDKPDNNQRRPPFTLPYTDEKLYTLDILVNGQHFQEASSMDLISTENPEFSIHGERFKEKELFPQIVAWFDLKNALSGRYSLVVTNPDRQRAWLEDELTITRGSKNNVTITKIAHQKP